MGAEAARAYMSIGEVLGMVRGEFPDVTISKIRFLESEGLIEPARAPSGYRRFTTGDVERLRFVLLAQRDHYLPLRVIKEHLAALDRGETPEDGPLAGLRAPRALAAAKAGTPAEDADVSYTRAELRQVAGVSEERLAELEEYGLLHRGGRFDATDLTVLRAVEELRRFGLHARHLRAVKASADRELGLIEQVVAPLLRQRGPGAHDRARETAREMAVMALRLHSALIEAGLRRL
ncbi:MAG: MerR family DNA-binding transcriptional regulator [Streptosporangiales bacterium]|nr:MerR family DNA-binding transcriptional regulator [Streptosporangiales bacterium]